MSSNDNKSMFEMLLEPGILGYYKSCEVTLCVLLGADKKAYNLFSLFCFESAMVQHGEKPVFLTKKNEKFERNVRLAVVQYRMTLEQVQAIYENLQSGKTTLDTPLGELYCGTLEKMPDAFVPTDSTVEIQLNRVLKNNFRGGSMLLEWFGQKNNINSHLPPKEFEKVLLRIHELLPIDLFSLQDRLGNVLFQFPEQIAYEVLGKDDCTVIFDRRVEHPEWYLLTVETERDDTMQGVRMARGKTEPPISIPLAKTGGPYKITLLDIEHGITILRKTTTKMRQISLTLAWGGIPGSERTIKNTDGEIKIPVNSQETNRMGEKAYSWKEAIDSRQYQKRMDELSKTKEFVQYGRDIQDRQKALEDIRAVMNRASEESIVYLWDPYLSARDLLDTWYYTKVYGRRLRAVTASVATGKCSVSDWIKEQRKILKEGSNQYGISIEWRIQHGNFGFGFHDRFLIILPTEDQPAKAWSLGTSINSAGKKHHILQKVSDPMHIANAFDHLWEQLEDPSCEIWNSQEEKNNG